MNDLATIPFYVIHTFTQTRHAGNPAAVCLNEAWLPDATMLRIAKENGLSETAFAIPSADVEGRWNLRWFTPKVEMSLCGHATLATAFALFHDVEVDREEIAFDTVSGTLLARMEESRVVLDFPSRPPTETSMPDWTSAFLSTTSPTSALVSGDTTVFVLPSERDVLTAQPHLDAIPRDVHAAIVTARGEGEVDFVSRYFAPHVGVPEDPVTGSAHCVLTPYWAGQLSKSTLRAQQLSSRGGEMLCTLAGDRVHLAGYAVLYVRGELMTTDT